MAARALVFSGHDGGARSLLLQGMAARALVFSEMIAARAMDSRGTVAARALVFSGYNGGARPRLLGARAFLPPRFPGLLGYLDALMDSLVNFPLH